MKPREGAGDPSTEAPTGVRDSELSDTAVGDPAFAEARPGLPPAGYEIGELLGRGGMGEVLLAHDLRIGRKVAIKRMRMADPTNEAVARFLREARIQARLDHPAIVPVHELGHDADDRPYFTMKRLAGVTLQQVLGDDHVSPQKLLRAFVDVCVAVDFAHSRGVIHRDLKPANIMLGDYGEVYVLDWGVARVIGDDDGPGGSGDIASLGGETQVGALLGTPGYMAPEQVRGEEVSRAIDVYALGSILFELLAGEPAHPRGQAAFASTLSSEPVSAAARRPEREIAPELDAACTAALAFDPDRRPTARALADRVLRYLDGDRDVEHRKQLAAEHLASARAAVDSGDPARRSEAMMQAGRALALDPKSDAATLVTKLMLEPPAEMPASLARQLVETERQATSRQARIGSFAVMSYLAFVPVMLWCGLTDWRPLAISVTLVVAMAGLSWFFSRRGATSVLWAVFVNAILLVGYSRFVGPFVLLPGLAGAVSVALISFPTLIDRAWIVIGAMSAAFLAPFALEATRIWDSTWWLEGGVLSTRPTAIHLDGTPGLVFLVAANLAMIVISSVFARSIAASRRDANRQLEIQAWHLAQLIPGAVGRPTPSPAR